MIRKDTDWEDRRREDRRAESLCRRNEGLENKQSASRLCLGCVRTSGGVQRVWRLHNRVHETNRSDYPIEPPLLSPAVCADATLECGRSPRQHDGVRTACPPKNDRRSSKALGCASRLEVRRRSRGCAASRFEFAESRNLTGPCVIADNGSDTGSPRVADHLS